MRHDAVIGGAGITGLTAAYRLQQAGFSVKVIERQAHVGGVIQSCQEEGYLTESGPNTFQSSGKAIMRLCGTLGLSLQAASPQAKKRYLYRSEKVSSGGLYPVPMNPLAILQTPLLSGKGKCRILLEPFLPAHPQPDESIAGFIRRRLGNE